MDFKVFIISKDATCGEYGRELYRHSWVVLAGKKGLVCLECADLDHLIFLPSGDAALTRRSAKHSTLSTAALEWSRSQKRLSWQCLPASGMMQRFTMNYSPRVWNAGQHG